ncbi:MAG: hypothetical protein WB709_08080 [Solirubrobacteraceae bacterium]
MGNIVIDPKYSSIPPPRHGPPPQRVVSFKQALPRDVLSGAQLRIARALAFVGESAPNRATAAVTGAYRAVRAELAMGHPSKPARRS